VHADARIEGEREHGEGADFAGDLDLPGREHLPGLVVPELQGGLACEPEPAELLFGRDMVAAKSGQRPL
jgi:hypothetical protein